MTFALHTSLQLTSMSVVLSVVPVNTAIGFHSLRVLYFTFLAFTIGNSLPYCGGLTGFLKRVSFSPPCENPPITGLSQNSCRSVPVLPFLSLPRASPLPLVEAGVQPAWALSARQSVTALITSFR